MGKSRVQVQVRDQAQARVQAEAQPEIQAQTQVKDRVVDTGDVVQPEQLSSMNQVGGENSTSNYVFGK